MSFISAYIVRAFHTRVCVGENGRVGMPALVVAVPHRLPRHPLRRFPACFCIEKGENLRTHDVAGRGGAAQEADIDGCSDGAWGRALVKLAVRAWTPRRVCACRLKARCFLAVARCLRCTTHRSQHTLAFSSTLDARVSSAQPLLVQRMHARLQAVECNVPLQVEHSHVRKPVPHAGAKNRCSAPPAYLRSS